MAVVNVTTFYRGVLTINIGKQGYKEVYDLGEQNLNSARITFGDLVNQRLWLLPSSFVIADATVFSKPATRVSYPVLESGQSGKAGDLTTAVPDGCNDVEFAPWFRFASENGRGCTRPFRGVPDSQVADRQLNLTRPEAGWGGLVLAGVLATDNPGTYVVALDRFLSRFKAVTRYMGPRKQVQIGGNPVQGYATYPWEQAIFKNMRKKNTGRPSDLSRGRAKIR